MPDIVNRRLEGVGAVAADLLEIGQLLKEKTPASFLLEVRFFVQHAKLPKCSVQPRTLDSLASTAAAMSASVSANSARFRLFGQLARLPECSVQATTDGRDDSMRVRR